MSAVRHFRVVVRAIQAHSNWVERRCGVSAAQLWALWEVFRTPGLRVSEISQRLSIKPATASNLLDKLEAKGLLERARRGPDQRVVQLYPTDEGSRLLASAPRPAEGALVDALSRLDDELLESLNGSLEALVDILRVKEEDSALAPIPPERQ
jgi:DNA-binding MarR family transcriptional regulator